MTGVETAPGRASRATTVLRARLPFHARVSDKAGTRVFYIFMVAVFGVFATSTIPGVRPSGHTGYNLLLDGILNNLAYALSPVLCVIRARKATAYRSSWMVLAVGLAL